MSKPLRLFILSGEPSGDRLATDLVRRLKATQTVELTGVGAGDLPAEGLVSIFPASELAVMGVADVVARLPKLLGRIREIANFIFRTTPEIVVRSCGVRTSPSPSTTCPAPRGRCGRS